MQLNGDKTQLVDGVNEKSFVGRAGIFYMSILVKLQNIFCRIRVFLA